jgi:hypothetical protein
VSLLFLGLDDTDFGESIGTGALARELSAFLERRGLATVLGITRHQLLVHPAIPYTSHNSAACLALRTEEASALADVAARFVRDHEHPGADPGICLATREQAGRLSDFGRQCQGEVVTREEAERAVAGAGAVALAIGGTGGGVIGASAAAGLRASGNDGRYLSLKGMRGLRGRTLIREVFAQTPIAAVVTVDGSPVDADTFIEIGHSGLRPALRGGEAVLVVRAGPSGALEPLPHGRGEDG